MSNLVDLGCDEYGSRVIMNREVFESDLPILIGHVLGNPYGGYSGGYKMASTGITHWRTISATHVPDVMHLPDFTPVSAASTMRRKFDAIGKHMEDKMGKKFFMCDSAKCTRCGLCYRMCPRNNITIDKDKGAVFGTDCIICMKCYNLCPVNAVLLAKASRNDKRYRRYKGPGRGIQPVQYRN